MKITLIYGGNSLEHDASILSAYSIVQHIFYQYYTVQLVYVTRDGQFKKGKLLNQPLTQIEELKEGISDCTLEMLKEEETILFSCLYGVKGEDGAIQGFFETLDIPYVGCGVLASACGMDNITMKMILQQAGIPQLPFVFVLERLWKENPRLIFEKCEGSLIYPMFVKPANTHSSTDLFRVETKEELQYALTRAFQYDSRVLVEQGIDARKIEIGLLGNEEIRVTRAGEQFTTSFFNDKIMEEINEQTTLCIPAEIDPSIEKKAQGYAKQVYQLLNGSGLLCCNFLLSISGELFLNEIKTMPMLTKTSMYPRLWQERGIQISDLIEELIQLAMKRYKKNRIFKNKIEMSKEK